MTTFFVAIQTDLMLKFNQTKGVIMYYNNNNNNNGYGYGYGYNQQQRVQQPQYNNVGYMQQQPQQYDLPITDIKFMTEDQIKGWYIYPNTRVLLIDRQNGNAYLETADSMGNFDKKVFKFTLISDNDKKIEQEKNSLNLPNFDNLATKEDIYQIFNEFKSMLEPKQTTSKKSQKEIVQNEQ